MTTEPTDVLISKAALTQLVADITVSAPVLFGGSTPVAMPFVAYRPTANVDYVDARPLLRATPENPSLAFDGSNIYRGVFQVDAVIADGKGESPGIRLASLIAARFPIGTKIPVAGRYYLKFNKLPTIAAALKDAAWVRFPVSIPYQLVIS